MDFEEQLEKAEKLSTPSLVGSSVRSADDSPHNNYIHPEKYQSHDLIAGDEIKRSKQLLNKELSASLDELINEGALIGSEEDFDDYLDDKGTVKSDAQYVASNSPDTSVKTKSKLSNDVSDDLIAQLKDDDGDDKDDKDGKDDQGDEKDDKDVDQVEQKPETEKDQTDSNPINDSTSGTGSKFLSNSDSHTDLTSSNDSGVSNEITGGSGDTSGFYSQQDYSTPNLSEYQLNNQIKDHDDLLSKIKQDDPHRLSRDISKENESFKQDKPTENDQQESKDKVSFNPLPLVDNGSSQRGPEGFHSPYFRRDARSDSRNGSRSRSRSRSAIRPHLARGDSYSNVHTEDPSKYELPPDFEPVADKEEEEDPNDRRSRQSKPTMGESIAAIEEEEKINQEKYQSQLLSRDASLLTTGDYTNFNVDNPAPEPTGPYSYNTRSNSSTNYLRSISRSRSRQPGGVGISGTGPVDNNEKNDANPSELYKEGALINEDPYSSIDNLDSMMDKVLHKEKHSGTNGDIEADDIKEEPEKELDETNEEVPDSKEINEEKLASEAVEPRVNEEALEASAVEDSAVPKEDAIEEEKLDNQVDEEIKDDSEPIAEEKQDDKDLEESDTKKDTIDENMADLDLKDKEVKEVDEKADETEEPEEVTKEPKSEESKPAADNDLDDSEDLDDLGISPEELRKHLESQPVYLLTSLIGGMQIIHKTNRLQTILKANEIEFTARDLSTDEEAKKIWRRYSNGKSLPGIIRGDDFIGNWEDLEEANEEYRVRELIYETL